MMHKFCGKLHVYRLIKDNPWLKVNLLFYSGAD